MMPALDAHALSIMGSVMRCLQVLLKAREIGHAVKLLFGSQIAALDAQPPDELSRNAAKTNLLQLLLVGAKADCLPLPGRRLVPEYAWGVHCMHRQTLMCHRGSVTGLHTM